MIIRYRKQVDHAAEPPLLADFPVRPYLAECDQDAWIALHRASFLPPHPWTRARFVREFLHKPWWDPERMWFAGEAGGGRPLATVTLGERQSATSDVGTVQWLAVLPPFRRRGLARLLMGHLESAAARRGYQWLELETLETWREAAELYRSLGYQKGVSLSS